MENNIAVLMSLNELVMNSTDINDQSIDNIRIVSNIMNQTALLISNHATLSSSNLKIVSIHCTYNFNSDTVQPGFPTKHANC